MIKKIHRPPGKVPEVFRHFEDFVRKVVTVPKSEIDKREEEYKKLRKSIKSKRAT